MYKLFKLFCIISLIGKIEPAKILAVFPVASISHQVVFRPLMHELAKRGHEVVVITPDPAYPKGQSPQNLTEIDIHDLSYKIWNDLLETGMGQNRITSVEMRMFLGLMTKAFEAQMKSEDVQKLLKDKSKSFDLLFTESCVRPALSFGYRYNVPIIEFSSLGSIFGSIYGTGVPTNYLVYPSPLRTRVYNLSLWEKISAVYNDYKIDKVIEEHKEEENKVVRGLFGPNVPDLSELKKNVHLMFLNVNPIWDFNRPVPPNIIYLGGIHQNLHKDLPKDIKSYLDSSQNGVIYMSFGTNARPSLLPVETLKVFTNVFSELPYDILCKWDKEELPNRPENVRVSKWLPQSDLLKHPNVKLFITQGGLQSTDEALNAGVPLVAIPFLGDQWFNAEQYEKLNIGIHLDLETITEKNLKNAIEKTIQDKTYRENVVKLHSLMRDQPQTPLERAVWWTEYVLRHGGATHLRAAGAHMHWTKYYAMDVVMLLVFGVLAILIVIIFTITRLAMQLKDFKNITNQTMYYLLKIYCVINVIKAMESARILAVYPAASISHQVVFRPLMHELAKRGHEVVVITTDPAYPKGKAPQNLTEIDLHDLSYKAWNDILETEIARNRLTSVEVKTFLHVMIKTFEAQVMSEDVQKLLQDKSKSFDLLFVESCVRPALSFGHRYNVPIIEFSSLGNLLGSVYGTGASTNYLVYPSSLRSRVYDLSLWEKISAVYSDYSIDRVLEEYEEEQNKVIRGLFGSNTPTLSELKKNVHLIFLNVNPIWDFNRPVPPNIIYLGGIHQKPNQELPKDIKTYLDSSQNGVIYLSFGTNARPSLLPTETLKIFTNVFSQLPYDIICRWDKEEIPNRPHNVRVSKWLPQSDILKHPNVKLFITQGGLQSTDEALMAGVPLVVIPFLGDQFFNAEHYVKLNIGIRVDLETITEDKLKNAIENAISDKTYRENVVKLHNIMRDQPQTPLERAVWWTEYVLRHGGATHLRAAAAHMHWTEYYAVDLIITVLAAFVILLVVIVLAIRFLLFKLQLRSLKFKIKIN
ncbi:uncharacterized protein LOC112045617 [Bicyclus anynana]|uniref:Uncharacterized protein LOC112045617 n=1 Tax=Bicyclus anynana TaxID=110368 RepID=A0ABM3LPQ9_BICAN|nr:uncharacterized protein LOC112045617 [Bicyclus anynana]